MNYKDFGLVNTQAMLRDALKNGYAVPAFNFFNMETLKAILQASEETKSPVILSVSESALRYMGMGTLMGMIRGQHFTMGPVALHLDHGSSVQICQKCIDHGFSSVMIDGSNLSLDENIAQTKQVVDYAHKHDVTVEAELGILAGIKDEKVFSDKNIYTNPDDVVRFVSETNVDSLAIAIGTSHGAYKRNSSDEELRFDILDEIAQMIPNLPLVLHGASSIPEHLIKTINEYGGCVQDARGIPTEQLRRAVSTNICKINVDSDARLSFTAAVRQNLSEQPTNIDPRKFLTAAILKMKETYIAEICDIMGSENRAI